MSASNRPPLRKDLSEAMLRALRSFYVGRPWSHLRGRSMFGASDATARSLHKKGLSDFYTNELSDDGLLECHARWGDDTVFVHEAAAFLGIPEAELVALADRGGIPRAGGASTFSSFRWRDLHAARRSLAASPLP